MALGASTIWDVRTTGSDTLNSGGFDPGQTAGMLTDGAATSANGNSPVFSSASYNFVAGDVGAWVYISSGTNWIAGWYQIASVASNAATLSAAIGQGYLAVNKNSVAVTTVAGCATVASPTGATWTIDYSQQASARFTYTDLASSGSGIVSAAQPFGKQQVGNLLCVDASTNWTAGIYVITSVAAGTNIATVSGAGAINPGTPATNGVGRLGGCMASPGRAMQYKVPGNDVFIKSGTYTNTSTTQNVAGGKVRETGGGTGATNATWIVGWDTTRTITNADATSPELNAGSQTGFTMVSLEGSYIRCRNLTVNGNSQSTTTGLLANTGHTKIDRITAKNTTSLGISFGGANAMLMTYCRATGCSGIAGILVNTYATAAYCESYANTCLGIRADHSATLNFCISSGNTGVGFDENSTGGRYYNCVSYGNTGAGYDCDGVGCSDYINCIAEANGALGFASTTVKELVRLVNCAGYNNTGGNYNSTQIFDVQGFIAQSAGSFFTNAASGDFSLNSTSGRGALLRAAGFPGVFPRGTTTGYQDIGAAQHQDAGGGSGGSALHLGGLGQTGIGIF